MKNKINYAMCYYHHNSSGSYERKFQTSGAQNSGTIVIYNVLETIGKCFVNVVSCFIITGNRSCIVVTFNYSLSFAFASDYTAKHVYVKVKCFIFNLFPFKYKPSYVHFCEYYMPGNLVYMADNTTHVYFFSFGKPGNKFCLSVNATHVHFSDISKSGKSFCMSDNATHVYFCTFYLSGNAICDYFSVFSKPAQRFCSSVNATRVYFTAISKQKNSFYTIVNAKRDYFSVIYPLKERIYLSAFNSPLQSWANNLSAGKLKALNRIIHQYIYIFYFLYVKIAAINRHFYLQKICPFKQGGVILPLVEETGDWWLVTGDW